MVATQGLRRENLELFFNRDSIWVDEKILEMESNDSYTIMNVVTLPELYTENLFQW